MMLPRLPRVPLASNFATSSGNPTVRHFLEWAVVGVDEISVGCLGAKSWTHRKFAFPGIRMWREAG